MTDERKQNKKPPIRKLTQFLMLTGGKPNSDRCVKCIQTATF